jgi:hypothetical protein
MTPKQSDGVSSLIFVLAILLGALPLVGTLFDFRIALALPMHLPVAWRIPFCVAMLAIAFVALERVDRTKRLSEQRDPTGRDVR